MLDNIDLTTPTDTELDEHAARVAVEQARRRVLAGSPQEAAEVIATREEELDAIARRYQEATAREHEAGTLENPTPWAPVAGPHQAWPRGWHVIHGGHIYRSNVPNNRQEPPHPTWTGPLEDA